MEEEIQQSKGFVLKCPNYIGWMSNYVSWIRKQRFSWIHHNSDVSTITRMHVTALVYFYTCGKFGPPYPGKATAAARAALPSPTNACWVFSCFRNPPNSDLDYRFFNVRAWCILMRAYTHGGCAHRQRVSTCLQWEKLILALLTGL